TPLTDRPPNKYARSAMQATVQSLNDQYHSQLANPAAVASPEPGPAFAEAEAAGPALIPAAAQVLAYPSAAPPRAPARKKEKEKAPPAPRKPGDIPRVPTERLAQLVRPLRHPVLNRPALEHRMTAVAPAIEDHRR